MDMEALISGGQQLITYVQAAEAQQKRISELARERTLINLLAANVNAHPLSSTAAVLDKSQSIGRTAMRADYMVGVIGAKSSMFSLADAETLSTMEVAALMGHQNSKLVLDGVSEQQFKKCWGYPCTWPLQGC